MFQAGPYIWPTQEADEAEIFDLFSCESQQLVKTQHRFSCLRKPYVLLYSLWQRDWMIQDDRSWHNSPFQIYTRNGDK